MSQKHHWTFEIDVPREDISALFDLSGVGMSVKEYIEKLIHNHVAASQPPAACAICLEPASAHHPEDGGHEFSARVPGSEAAAEGRDSSDPAGG
jgi:hypothetical protein